MVLNKVCFLGMKRNSMERTTSMELERLFIEPMVRYQESMADNGTCDLEFIRLRFEP